MNLPHTRNELLFIAASAVVTVVFAAMFLGPNYGLRAAWPFWASLLCTSVFVWIPYMRQRMQPRDRVDFDELGIQRLAAGGTRESVRWDRIERIFIATTDDGPVGDDVFWVFVDESGQGGCAVPASAEGFDALLERVQQLPGFDNEAVATAMGSTTNARFDVWQRQPD
ncbi:hypothetical protein [Alkalisalibacterium limincola]|uniref:Uncharacterized protein n=1 Tax=Alkalisalibacterium limincola TaxID=2699169 RepID=A0A5C8KN97_9GAMM|nr:hypothetical protein [Alkalisalibacterium limincola]TXK62143.1 hypothetical protein FU658_09945 [Alkalisalibacterium limincola]